MGKNPDLSPYEKNLFDGIREEGAEENICKRES
jgi:hypothetical protein